MGLADRLKDVTKKAQDAAVEHQDQILNAVEKAKVTADQQTGGKYHEQIAKAGAKAEAYVQSLTPDDEAPPSEAASAKAPGAATPHGQTPASVPPVRPVE